MMAPMSALPPKADMCDALVNVRFVPQRGTHAAQQRVVYSITSSARPSSVAGTSSARALAVLRLITSSNFVGS